jgi:DNA-binding IclR family transcriptional regulator
MPSSAYMPICKPTSAAVRAGREREGSLQPAVRSELRPILETIRKNEYAHERGRRRRGIDCIASPVMTRHGRAVAALGMAYMSAPKKPEQEGDRPLRGCHGGGVLRKLRRAG